MKEPAADLDVEAAAIGRVERARIERALWALSEEQRIAIALMDIVGFTAAEVASIIGSPRLTVLARVHGGRCWPGSTAAARPWPAWSRRRRFGVTHEPEVARWRLPGRNPRRGRA